MSRFGAVPTILAALVTSACTSNQIVGRFRTAECETVVLTAQPGEAAFAPGTVPNATSRQPCAALIPAAAASAVSIPTPPSSSPIAGTALPEHFGAAYVNALAKYSTSAKDLRANLAAPIAVQEASPGALDRSVFKRTLIVTVSRTGSFNPIDRLEATEVVVRPRGARFDNWDTLATAYTTIDAGKVQLTQTRGATESLTVGAPAGAPVSGSISVGGSQTDTRVENFAAQSRVETLTAALEDDGKALRIRRQGGYGIDLTGNTVVKVEMAYTGNPSPGQPDQWNRVSTYFFSAPAYTNARGVLLTARQVRLVGRPVTSVPPGTGIPADIYLTYTVRHVKSGGDTYEEKDDNILERTVGPVRNTVMLIPAREASPPGFGLHLTSGPNSGFGIQVAPPGRAAVPLCFATEPEASDFLAYMTAANAVNPGSIGDSRLGVTRPDRNPNNPPLVPLTPADLSAARVQPRCV